MMNLFKHPIAHALFGLCVSLTLTGCNETIDARQLDTVQGLKYKLHDTEPFTGTVINLIEIENKTLMNCTAEFVKGELHGSIVCAARNGVTVLKATYKNNLKHGVEKIWNSKTENLYSKTAWKNNRKHGREEIYNPEGELVEQRDWHEGNKDGDEKEWDFDGTTLLKQYHWEDGKKTGYCKCEDTEESYKDGKLHGIRRMYSQKSHESHDESNKKHMRWSFNNKSGLIWLGSYDDYYIEIEEEYENGKRISEKRFTDPSRPESYYL